MRVNNKRKHAHQMRASAPKRALLHAFFDTHLRENGACVLRVRRPLISDLCCTFWSVIRLRRICVLCIFVFKSGLFLHCADWANSSFSCSCNFFSSFLQITARVGAFKTSIGSEYFGSEFSRHPEDLEISRCSTPFHFHHESPYVHVA